MGLATNVQTVFLCRAYGYGGYRGKIYYVHPNLFRVSTVAAHTHTHTHTYLEIHAATNTAQTHICQLSTALLILSPPPLLFILFT